MSKKQPFKNGLHARLKPEIGDFGLLLGALGRIQGSEILRFDDPLLIAGGSHVRRARGPEASKVLYAAKGSKGNCLRTVWKRPATGCGLINAGIRGSEAVVNKTVKPIPGPLGCYFASGILTDAGGLLVLWGGLSNANLSYDGPQGRVDLVAQPGTVESPGEGIVCRM